MTAPRHNQADKAKPAAPKKRKGYIRQAFNSVSRVLIGSALVFGSYQYYTPPKYKAAVDHTIDQVEYTLHIKQRPAGVTPGSDKLTFIFENKDAPVVLGVQSTPLNNSQTDMPEHWVAMMGRHEMALKNPENAAKYAAWLSQLDKYKDSTLAQKAKAVDALVDTTVKYQSDTKTYHQGEYWASPLEILNAKKGDCEDFAILKYYALRYLDVPASKMYVIAVGAAPGEGLNHATLIVNIAEPQPTPAPSMAETILSNMQAPVDSVKAAPVPAHYVVLEDDNTEKGRLLDPDKLNYHAYFAMNEAGVWRVPQQKAKPPAAPAPKKPAPPKGPLTS